MSLFLRLVLLLVPVTLVIFFALAVWSRRGPAASGLVEGALRDCGNRRNCVSSEPGARRRVAPLLLGDSHGLERVHTALLRLPRSRVLAQAPGYLHVEVRTRLLGFADDLEFRLDESQGVIHVRSGSRVGYSDRGANRARIEELRRLFEETP